MPVIIDDDNAMRQDSLRPTSVESSLPTLPPKKKRGIFPLYYGLVLLFVSTLAAGSVVYGIYIMPTLGKNTLAVNLAVILLVTSQCTLLALHLLALDFEHIKNSRR